MVETLVIEERQPTIIHYEISQVIFAKNYKLALKMVKNCNCYACVSNPEKKKGSIKLLKGLIKEQN